MNVSASLEEDYKELLREAGISEEYFILKVSWFKEYAERKKRENEAHGVNMPDMVIPEKDVSINETFRNWSRPIINSFSLFGDSLQEVDTLTGVFPTGSINAQAALRKSGVLILINDGLTAFMQQFVGILLRFTYLQDRLFRDELTDKLDDRWDVDRTTDELADLFADYLVKGTTHSLSAKYGHVGGGLGLYFSMLDRELINFVLAHEHAHAFLGHLCPTRRVKSMRTPVGDIELITKSWEEELSADVMGLSAQFRLSKHQEELFQRLPFIIGATSVFFCMDDMITTLNREVADSLGLSLPIISDHPPAEARLKAIQDRLLSCNANDAVFSQANIFQDSIRHLKDKIVTCVLKRFRLDQSKGNAGEQF